MSPSGPMPPIRLVPVPGPGPEDVLFGDDGSILTGLRDGRIVRVAPEGEEVEILADTGGVPLGLEWLEDGRLLVCDAVHGLLTVAPSGEVAVLVDTVDGEPLSFCNNAAVAADGTIYFTSSTRRHDFERHRRDIIENLPTGRLLCRHTDGNVVTLMDDLAFANGVALAPDESFVLVAETGARRIRSRRLAGAGTSEVFAEDLPGLPDNLSVGSDGLVWAALVVPGGADLRLVHALPAWMRRVAARLPGPAPGRLCRVMAFDLDGAVVHDLDGDAGQFHMVTGVRESEGTVALGSLEESAIALFETGA